MLIKTQKERKTMVVHICHADEDITQIAARYGVSAAKILEDNGKEGQERLLEGEVLLLFPASPIHRLRRNETVESICEKENISPAKLLRQNPTLNSGGIGYPGQILHTNRLPLPGLSVIGRAEGEDHRYIRRALPYLDALVLAGGRLCRGRIELPRRSFLPENFSVFAEVSLKECTAAQADALWQRCREEGFSGILADCEKEEPLSLLAACKRGGETLLAPIPHREADGVIGGNIPILPLGGVRSFGGEEQALSEGEKDELLRRWQSPIRRGETAQVEKTLYFAGNARQEILSFSDIAMKKAILHRWVEDGIRSIFIPRLRDLTIPLRTLLGNAFDRCTPLPQ